MRHGAGPWVARATFAISALVAYPYFYSGVGSGKNDVVVAGAAYLLILTIQVATLAVLWLSIAPQRFGMRAATWTWISAYYYFGAVFAAALAGQLQAGGYLLIVTIGMAVGAFALAATADGCMTLWESRPSMRSDIAVFLVGTHVLATLVLAAFLTNAIWSDGDPISKSLIDDGAIALTVLAIPLCAGFWARLRSSPETLSNPENDRVAAGIAPRSTSAARLMTGVVLVLVWAIAARGERSRIR